MWTLVRDGEALDKKDISGPAVRRVWRREGEVLTRSTVCITQAICLQNCATLTCPSLVSRKRSIESTCHSCSGHYIFLFREDGDKANGGVD